MTPAGPNLGILVLGYARPQLLRLVLESLARQHAVGLAHVWIDGTADRMELRARTEECAAVARDYPIADLRAHRGHLGIEKLMLDGLGQMVVRYDRILVLEDDCFPTRSAVAEFQSALDKTAGDPRVFSVYGHPFLVPGEGDEWARFQGWGWATTREKLLPVLARARELFLLPECEYLAYTRSMLQPEIVARLDVTPGRNVCEVLTRFYSWDSCTALLTALAGQVHRRLPQRAVFNCGIGGDSGHFPAQSRLRHPPFNMVEPDEVWNHF